MEKFFKSLGWVVVLGLAILVVGLFVHTCDQRTDRHERRDSIKIAKICEAVIDSYNNPTFHTIDQVMFYKDKLVERESNITQMVIAEDYSILNCAQVMSKKYDSFTLQEFVEEYQRHYEIYHSIRPDDLDEPEEALPDSLINKTERSERPKNKDKDSVKVSYVQLEEYKRHELNCNNMLQWNRAV